MEVRICTADGSLLAGSLFLPEGPGPFPAVLFCQGLSGTRSLVMPAVAARFQAAGFAFLGCDYRGYGESQGPRGWVHPGWRVEDSLHAFAWLAARPEVDPGRMGIYGLSLGGPVALGTAAEEPRARAVVSISGPPDGERLMRYLRTSSQWIDFRARVLEDRARRARGEAPEQVPLAELIPLSARLEEQYQTLKPAGPPPPTLQSAPPQLFFLASAEAILRFRPLDVAHRLAPRPVLCVNGVEDDCATIEDVRELCARAGPGARLVEVPGYAHVDLDVGPGLEYQVGLAVDFFRRHLTPLQAPPLRAPA
jgi:pimeloyl-ACP methyl ester carboxylesterase